MTDRHTLSRRATLVRVAAASAVAAGIAPSPAAGATARPRTPAQSEGPFYPVERPADAGEDLLHGANGAVAGGVPLALRGRVLDTAGAPVAGATVEIWQCDHRGVYRHPRARGRVDPAFAGFGRSRAASDGRYAFLTIVPVPYTGRPPHIHAKVFVGGREALTTQLYLADHPQNAGDWLFSRAGASGREALLIDPQPATIAGDLSGRLARFDFVV